MGYSQPLIARHNEFMARRQVGSNQYSTRWEWTSTVDTVSSDLMIQASGPPKFISPPLPAVPGQRLRALTTVRSQLSELLQQWFDELGPWLIDQGPQTASDGTVLTASQGQPRKRWDFEQIWTQLSEQANEMSAVQALDTVRQLVQSGSWSVTGIREWGLNPEQMAHVQWGERIARPDDGAEPDPQVIAWRLQLQDDWNRTTDASQRLDMVAAGLHQQTAVRDELRRVGVELAQLVPPGDEAVDIDGVAVVAHRESSWTQWNHDACWEGLERAAERQNMSGSQAVDMAKRALGSRKWRSNTWCDRHRSTDPGRWSIKEVTDEPVP